MGATPEGVSHTDAMLTPASCMGAPRQRPLLTPGPAGAGPAPRCSLCCLEAGPWLEDRPHSFPHPKSPGDVKRTLPEKSGVQSLVSHGAPLPAPLCQRGH